MATVHVVHCIDTEGPLHETLDATFERLRIIFHIDMEPSLETLRKLQSGDLDLGGKEKAVQRMLDPRLLDYNDDWGRIDQMLDRVMVDDFRHEVPDSHGNAWIYNWFCVDHVGYDVNPRRRDIGYHNIFDHYRKRVEGPLGGSDAVHFHFHPHHPILQHAHRSGTHWFANSTKLFQILARRVIDRAWFPAANRPGFHLDRPDSHWFLEQYIPFDLGNQATEAEPWERQQRDLHRGMWGDWRRAPVTWEPYHPSHDDYQVPGECRRWIARVLDVGTRTTSLPESEVRRAFDEARAGKAVVLGMTDHDFRDLAPDVNYVRDLLTSVARDYPDVDFRYCEAVEAMRSALRLPDTPACDLQLDLEDKGEHEALLRVRTTTPSFGPQPFLAVKTTTGTYFSENLIMERPHHEWAYIFNRETVRLEHVETVGLAANNATGVTTVARLDPRSGKTDHTYWNTGQLEP